MARADDPLAVARARLLTLKAAHEAGTLDDKRFDEQRRAVEREIGERLLVAPGSVGSAAARPSMRLVLGLAAAVVAVAAIGYWNTGTPSQVGLRSAPTAIAAEAPAPSASAASSLQQIAAMVDRLAERMKQQPDDPVGWTMLARSYTVLGRFADALPAYARAVELQPKDATLLADYADAVAATKGTVSNPESIALIERALAADPKHPKALALAGTLAYERGDYAIAIADWQKIIDQLPPGNELVPQIQASIDEARSRVGGAPAETPTAGGAPAKTPVAGSTTTPAPGPAASSTPARSALAAAPASGTSVSGVVTIDPAMRAEAAPGDSVFVFARAAAGGRMPLAVLRAKVSDLPITFRLDDSMAMAPGMTISSAKMLTVGARISKNGSAIGQAGDLEGEVTPVAPGAKDLRIRIDRKRQ
ncbi:MAG: tetratricopeptide repeat protein [Caldimonas sp.]